MPQGPSHTYQCQSKGCPNGYQSAFEGAPPEWFKKKGFNTPVRCPDCRKWMKAQTDESYHCGGCNQLMRVSAKKKIRHHIAEGPYAHEKCRRCQRGQSIGKIVVEKLYPLALRLEASNAFKKLPLKRPIQSYRLDTDPTSYERLTGNVSDRHSRRVHLERHTVWSEHSRVNWDGPDKKSATMLSREGGSFEGLLRSAAVIANSTSVDQVREYFDKRTNRIVKVTMSGSGRIEATFIHPQAGINGHELVTSYDSLAIEEILDKTGSNGDWT